MSNTIHIYTLCIIILSVAIRYVRYVRNEEHEGEKQNSTFFLVIREYHPNPFFPCSSEITSRDGGFPARVEQWGASQGVRTLNRPIAAVILE